MKLFFLTGPGRSGTTILSKYLATHQNCELAYEPPFLFFLFDAYSSNKISKDIFFKLYDSYLEYDFLFESLSGRRINTNTNDDSTVYSYLSALEVEFRLSRSHMLDKDLLDKAQHHNVILKMPGMAYIIRHFLEFKHRQTNLAIIRNPYDNIKSLCQKEWFTDEGLRSGRIYPLGSNSVGKIVPFWALEYTDEFIKMTNNERAALYVYCELLAILHSKCPVVFYEELVMSAAYRNSLCSSLGLIPTSMTKLMDSKFYNSSIGEVISTFSPCKYSQLSVDIYKSLKDISFL